MLLKLGVDISRLADPIRSRLSAIDSLWRTWGEEVIITSTYEGEHSAGSLHYVNRAIDLRLPKNKGAAQAVDAIKGLLGDDYDVVLEKTHIHVEHDPA